MGGEEYGALARVMAVEERLAALVSRTGTRAETMVAEAKARAEARTWVERERLAEAEAALVREMAADRERRLALVREDAESELARYADVGEEIVDALAAWVVERIVATGPSDTSGVPEREASS